MDEFAIAQLDGDVEQEWDRLAVATSASPFLRPGWVLASAAAFGGTSALRLATVRRSGLLVAALPLLFRRGVAATVTNSETAENGIVAHDDEAARTLAAGLLARRLSCVDLQFLTVGQPTERVLRAAESTARRPFLWYPARTQAHIDLSADWAEYERRQLSSRRRRQLRISEGRLGELGPVELEIIEDPGPGLGKLFDEGFGIELDGWKGRSGTAVLSQPTTTNLYRQVAQWAAEAGILRLVFLRVDGRPAAFALNLEQDGIRYGLKVTFAEEFARHSPGTLLLHRMVRQGMEDPGLRRFNLLGAAEGYKLVFADGFDEQVRLRMFGRGMDAAARHTYYRARSSARARLSGAGSRLSTWADLVRAPRPPREERRGDG